MFRSSLILVMLALSGCIAANGGVESKGDPDIYQPDSNYTWFWNTTLEGDLAVWFNLSAPKATSCRITAENWGHGASRTYDSILVAPVGRFGTWVAGGNSFEYARIRNDIVDSGDIVREARGWHSFYVAGTVIQGNETYLAAFHDLSRNATRDQERDTLRLFLECDASALTSAVIGNSVNILDAQDVGASATINSGASTGIGELRWALDDPIGWFMAGAQVSNAAVMDWEMDRKSGSWMFTSNPPFLSTLFDGNNINISLKYASFGPLGGVWMAMAGQNESIEVQSGAPPWPLLED